MSTITTTYDVGDTVYIVYPDYSINENMYQFTEYQIFECEIDTIEIYSQENDLIVYYHLNNENSNYRNVRILESEVFGTKDDAKTYLTNKLSDLNITNQTYIDSL